MNFQESVVLKSSDGIGYTIEEEVNAVARREAEQRLRDQEAKQSYKPLRDQLSARKEAAEAERLEQSKPSAAALEEEDVQFLEEHDREIMLKRQRQKQEESDALKQFKYATMLRKKEIDFGDGVVTSIDTESDVSTNTDAEEATRKPSGFALGAVVKRRKINHEVSKTTSDSKATPGEAQVLLGADAGASKAPMEVSADSANSGSAKTVSSAPLVDYGDSDDDE